MVDLNNLPSWILVKKKRHGFIKVLVMIVADVGNEWIEILINAPQHYSWSVSLNWRGFVFTPDNYSRVGYGMMVAARIMKYA